MAKTIKRVRSPVTGTLIGVRIQPDLLQAIDKWRKKQKEGLTRPEAIRAMIKANMETRKNNH